MAFANNILSFIFLWESKNKHLFLKFLKEIYEDRTNVYSIYFSSYKL